MAILSGDFLERIICVRIARKEVYGLSGLINVFFRRQNECLTY